MQIIRTQDHPKRENSQELSESQRENAALRAQIVQMGNKLDELSKCNICGDRVIDPTAIISCGHVYCRKCLDAWFKIKRICPYCRQNCTDILRIRY